MKLYVALEERFVLSGGRPASYQFTYDRFWRRYLAAFDEVVVLGRLQERECPEFEPVEGPGVRFVPLPGYRGPWQYLRHRRELRRRLEAAYDPQAAYLLRVPGMVGTLVAGLLRRRGHPYAVEVVGDPAYAFARGSDSHPLRPFFRWYFVHNLRRQCAEAEAAAYVTEHALQRSYPSAPQALTTHYSSVELAEADFAGAPREFAEPPRPLRLVTVISMAHLQKAPDVLLEAMAQCAQQGVDLQLTLVGDGALRPWLERRAGRLGLEGRVRFTGKLPAGAAVLAELDGADLFVLPSRQEGLPRAMIEAMARGLPCLGSTVSGIPELLPAEDLVPPGEVAALAGKIAALAGDAERMSRAAARNLGRARDYRAELLEVRRTAFYREVRARAEARQQTAQPAGGAGGGPSGDRRRTPRESAGAAEPGRMNLTVALEEHFRLHQGQPASLHLTYDRFWRHYLEVFDSVTVVGRLFDVEEADYGPVEGPGVRFVALPAYHGPWQYLLRAGEIRRRVAAACDRESAYLLRMPGMIGTVVWEELCRRGHPYAVEVVGDPWDSLAPRSMRHPLRPFFRRWFCWKLRQQCRGAAATLYVTREALQRRYPPAPGAFTLGCSDVELPPEALAAETRDYSGHQGPWRLILVGGMTQLYKAQDVLVEALGRAARRGLDFELTLVGDGQYRPQLERRAQELGIGERLRCTGQLSGGAAVWTELDRADLFVLPSRQEGLPRAMVEAMARALPCVGSTVGGIPELLPPEDMVAPERPEALARKLEELLGDPARLRRESARNLAVAREYSNEALRERRLAFLHALRDLTER